MKEDKELLLKDLCGRLPYNTIVDYAYNAYDVHKGHYVKHGSKCILDCYLLDIFMSPRQNEEGEYIKPYLRPMSSMTKEEINEFATIVSSLGSAVYYDEWGISIPVPQNLSYEYLARIINWLNVHHFDYRNLIDKDLAISTEIFNPYRL